MRRSKVALTPTLCQRAKSVDGKKKTLWDGSTLGLALVVTPNGIKTWWFVARREGKQIWIRIGEYQKPRNGQEPGAVWTVDAAQGEAARLRKLHDEGKDIHALAQAKRTPKTLDDLIAHYLDSRKAKKLAPATQHNEKGLLVNHIAPALGKRLIGDLDRNDVESMFKEIEAKGIKSMATAATNLLSKLINYAVDVEWRKPGENPCKRVERVPISKRSRTFTASEYETINATIQKHIGPLGITQDMADIIYLCAYSGMRIGEVCSIRWANINWDTHCILVQEHKTAKASGDKLVPINSAMERVIKGRKTRTLNAWLFPSTRAKCGHKTIFVSGDAWEFIRAKAYLADTTLHDFRRTFSTIGVDLGYSPGVMDELLGHKLPGVQSHYVHLTVGGILAEASEAVSSWIDAAMNGKRPQLGVRIGAVSEKKA